MFVLIRQNSESLVLAIDVTSRVRTHLDMNLLKQQQKSMKTMTDLDDVANVQTMY